jgi:uncharacterized membrane protein
VSFVYAAAIFAIILESKLTAIEDIRRSPRLVSFVFYGRGHLRSDGIITI